MDRWRSFISCCIVIAAGVIVGCALKISYQGTAGRVAIVTMPFLFISLWSLEARIIRKFSPYDASASLQNDGLTFLAFIPLSITLPYLSHKNLPVSLGLSTLLLAAFALCIIFKVIIFSRKGIALFADQRVPVILLAVFIVYTAFFIALNFIKLNAFGFCGRDVLWFQQCSLVTDGKPFYTTAYTPNGGKYMFGGHASFFWVFILPLYMLIPHAMTLLSLRVIFITAGMWGIYLIAKQLRDHAFALIFALCYLLYVPVASQNIYEFFEIHLSVPFLIFAFYQLQKNNFPHFMTLSLLGLSLREDLALTTGAFGLYAFMKHKKWKFVVWPIVISAVWLLLSIFVIVPFFCPGKYPYPHVVNLRYLGNTMPEIILKVLTSPVIFEKIAHFETWYYLSQILLPLLFFPLMSPEVVLAIPQFIVNILPKYGMTASFYLGLPSSVFFFISSIFAADKIITIASRAFSSIDTRKMQCVIGGMLLFSSSIFFGKFIYDTFSTFSVFRPYYQFNTMVPEHSQALRTAISLVPKWSKVLIPRYIGPYFDTMDVACIEPENYKIKFYDYVIVDTQTGDTTQALENQNPQVVSLPNNPDFQLIFQKDGVMVYKKRR